MPEFVKIKCFTCYIIVESNKWTINCVNEWTNDETMLRWFNMIECCVEVYSMYEYMMWSESIIMWIIVNSWWWLLRCVVQSENYYWCVEMHDCLQSNVRMQSRLCYCRSIIIYPCIICCRFYEIDVFPSLDIGTSACPKLRCWGFELRC